MGYETGGNLPEGETEGKEDRIVRGINNKVNIVEIIKQFTGEKEFSKEQEQKFKAIEEMIQTKRRIIDKIKDVDNEVIKDPAFFNRYEECLDNWVKNRKDLKFLIMIRELENSYKSIKRKKFEDIFLEGEESLEDWKERIYKTHFQFIKKLVENKIPFEYLKFPEVIDDYENVHKTLMRLGLEINYEKGKETWDKLINKELVHFK